VEKPKGKKMHKHKRSPEHLEAILPFAKTLLQREYIEGVRGGLNVSEVAKKLGRSETQVYLGIQRVEQHAAKNGIFPDGDMTRQAAPGYSVKGVSTLYNKEGQVTAQWVKTRADDEERLKAIQESIADMADSIPKMPNIKAPKIKALNKSLLAHYAYFDPHFGGFSIASETGGDWNLSIAEKAFKDTLEYSINEASGIKKAVFVLGGDVAHYDRPKPLTHKSGHVIDTDCTVSQIFKTADDCVIGTFTIKACGKEGFEASLTQIGGIEILLGRYYLDFNGAERRVLQFMRDAYKPFASAIEASNLQ
jgi:hypothetical protein